MTARVSDNDRLLCRARGVQRESEEMGSNIRVLYLQPAPLFGGAERQAAEQALFLPPLGFDIVMIGGPGQAIASWMRGAPLARFIHSSNFPAWPPQRGLRALTLLWRYAACGLRAHAEFARVLQQERIDVVVASLPFTWVVGTLVARAAGVPIVWRAGGSRIPWSQKLGLWLLTRFIRPDLLLCNSQAVRGLFHPLVGGRVAVVRNGVDPAEFGPTRGDVAGFRPKGARIVVGFAGRLARSKHPETLIAMAARLRDRHPEVAVLVAGEGSERALFERKARAAGADNLHFLGFVADMASFYAACDVIVLPSESEGSSNVLLEAMRSQKAVVATNIAPVLELIEDGVNGLVYPLGDAEALTLAVERLLGSPELVRLIGKKAAERVADLTAQSAAQKLARILRDVVAEGPRGLRPEPSEHRPRKAAPKSLAGSGEHKRILGTRQPDPQHTR